MHVTFYFVRHKETADISPDRRPRPVPSEISRRGRVQAEDGDVALPGELTGGGERRVAAPGAERDQDTANPSSLLSVR